MSKLKIGAGKKVNIPKPTLDERIKLESKFTDAFGMSHRKISKDSLALMIVNQTANVNKTNRDAVMIAKIGLAMKRQRDWYLKLIRKKND